MTLTSKHRKKQEFKDEKISVVEGLASSYRVLYVVGTKGRVNYFGSHGGETELEKREKEDTLEKVTKGKRITRMAIYHVYFMGNPLCDLVFIS